jgi:hypothetical protein
MYVTVTPLPLRADSITTHSNSSFSLTFNKPIQSTSLNGANVSISNSTVRFTKTSGTFNTGTYSVTATDYDGLTINVTVRLSWFTYSWSITSQG